MNTQKLFKIATLFLVLFSVAACSSDNDDDNESLPFIPTPNPAVSRDVKYEVTGNAVGNFSIVYVSENGSGVNEPYPTLPYVRQFTAQASVPSVSYTTGVTGATAGQIITAKMYIGGTLQRQATVTVDSGGSAAVTLQSYIFE